MDPVTLAILGGLALAALASRRPTAPQQPPVSGGGGSGAPPAAGGGGGVDLAKLGAGGAAVAGALALSEASGQVARVIGGTDLSEGVGRVFGAHGVTAVAGAQLGKELDKALGGTTGTLRSDVAQGGTGLVAGVTSALGSTALALGIPGFLLVASFAVGIGQLVVLAYAVVWVWDEVTRLAQGQKGAKLEYDKAWAKAYGQFHDAIEKEGIARGMSVPASLIDRYAFALADGYLREKNRAAFRMWMRRAWGIGASAYQHAIHGRDRAWYLGEPSNTAVPELIVEPELRSVGPKYMSWVPKEDLGNPVTVPVEDIEFVTDVPEADYGKYKWTDGASVQKTFDVMTGKTVITYYGNVYVQTGTTVVYDDTKRAALWKAGRIIANFDAYVGWMKEPRGAGQSELSHLNYGKAEGRFEGEGDSNGGLTYEGVSMHWKGKP